MTTFLQIGLFIVDATLVATTAWFALCAIEPERRELLETTLSWIILGLAWIVFSGVLLGFGGWLGRNGFISLHLLGLTGLIIWRQKWKEYGKRFVGWFSDWRILLRSGSPEGLIAIGLILILSFLAVLAAQAEPTIFDALTYRLPRIGQWLQDGYVASFQTDDPRLNYMPVGPDLVIAWLLGATNEGFYLAGLSQLPGGILILGATFGLARLAGLSRQAALGAAALVLGMANVAVQFTTVQSDLFTAGIFSASYLLWQRAWARNESSWIGGIGIALAWGSKGTLFYLAPGAMVWVGWLLCQRGCSWRILRPTAGGAILGLLIFVGPSYYRNLTAYRSLFGPPASMVLHHGEPLTLGQHMEKLELNLGTSAVQLFDPTSQPFWAQDLSRAVGRRLLPTLSAQHDRYLFVQGAARRFLVRSILQQLVPDADVLSCGMLAVIVFLLGILIAGIRCTGDPSAPQILVWSGGLVLYFLVQNALVQWNPWAFRFCILAAPWLGAVGAWGICRLAQRIQLAVWIVVVVSALQVFSVVQWSAYQAPWQAITNPDSCVSLFIYRHWRAWAGQLDRPEKPLRLAFPANFALAAFYRMTTPRLVTLERLSELKMDTAESAVSANGGWLVVPAFMFKGREGHVMGQTWLFNGKENSTYSLAAYRALLPGESTQPMLYDSSGSTTADGIRHRLLIKSWQPQMRLWLRNPVKFSWKFEVRTDRGKIEGQLQAGETIELQIQINPDALNEVVLNFQPTLQAQDEVEGPMITLTKP